jgi:hypothetical protein
MKYFVSQRLKFKYNSLDKYDFLDVYSVKSSNTQLNCVFTRQSKVGNALHLNLKSNLTTQLLIEWVCSQKSKYDKQKHLTQLNVVTTLRKDKMLYFFDDCLNYFFLLNSLKLNKSADYFTLNFIYVPLINDHLISNDGLKKLISSSGHVILLYKTSSFFYFYLKI